MPWGHDPWLWAVWDVMEGAGCPSTSCGSGTLPAIVALGTSLRATLVLLGGSTGPGSNPTPFWATGRL